MSVVFIADSNVGKLIIHISDLVGEHKRNEVWKKFSGLAMLLSSHKEIPAPPFRYVGLIEDQLVLAEDFIDGVPAGTRIIKDGVIVDRWTSDRNAVLQKLLRALAQIHTIALEGFGWPIQKEKTLKGGYITWKGFLMGESPRWLTEVSEADEKLGLPPVSELPEKIEKIISQIDYAGGSVLVHGDAINPSNIIVKNNGEIALLDWEWVIAADPAWEFCDLGWWSLLESLKNGNDEIKDFLNRINLYIPLWLSWGTSMHAKDAKPEIYLALRKLLIDKVE